MENYGIADFFWSADFFDGRAFLNDVVTTFSVISTGSSLGPAQQKWEPYACPRL